MVPSSSEILLLNSQMFPILLLQDKERYSSPKPVQSSSQEKCSLSSAFTQNNIFLVASRTYMWFQQQPFLGLLPQWLCGWWAGVVRLLSSQNFLSRLKEHGIEVMGP